MITARTGRRASFILWNRKEGKKRKMSLGRLRKEPDKHMNKETLAAVSPTAIGTGSSNQESGDA
jgi:hypothetical protein